MPEFLQFNPVAVSIGPVDVHWYGLMYLVGFLAFYFLGRVRARDAHRGVAPEQVGDMLFYGVLGVVLGGRIGYVLFYNFSGLLADPLALFRIWEGGMSFHGGLLGVFAALYLFQRKHGIGLLRALDFASPLVTVGLGAGRIGNFINGELWGRVSDLPWAMVFPYVGADPRHPSQLYQFALEGVLLFAVLWIYSAKPRPPGAVAGLFAMLYAAVRFAVEFVREPDVHIGFIAWGWLTIGQALSIPLFLAGAAIFAFGRRAPIR